MTTTEKNRLIAEFMGYTQPHPNYPNSTYWYKEGQEPLTILLFEQDWNWLMPVVFKITEIKGVYKEEQQKVFNSISPIILDTHNAVVQFIQWYNTQKAN